MQPATLMEIDPSLTIEEIEANLPSANTFDAFIESYKWAARRLTHPNDYAIAARRLLEDLHAQNVQYAEVTLSAGVILWRELDLSAIYDAIWQETHLSAVPAFWILDAIRHFGPEPAMRVAEFAVSRRDHGVVAFGLGGDEQRGPAEWFGDVFAFARRGGLHLVCHAGETAGPESVLAALEIGAERIGHGIAAAQDSAVLGTLRDRNIPLEICITSNIATGAVPALADHPARRIYDAGVPLVLNTDDPALFRTDLLREYELAERVFGLPVEQLALESLRYGFSAGGLRP